MAITRIFRVRIRLRCDVYNYQLILLLYVCLVRHAISINHAAHSRSDFFMFHVGKLMYKSSCTDLSLINF